MKLIVEVLTNKWHVRKLQKIKHGSYVVSLPPEWIKEKGLNPHTELYVIQNDSHIIITLPLKNNTIEIDLSNYNHDVIRYIILTYYMQGADEIVLVSHAPIDAETKRYIKSVVSRLKGADISTILLNRVEIKIEDELPYINYEKFINIIRNQLEFIISALTDLISGLTNDDDAIVAEISERTEDYDKVYRYIIRLISKMAQFPWYNVFPTPRELIAYATLAKDMARAVYYVKKVADGYLAERRVDKKLMEALLLSLEIYKFAYSLYTKLDLNLCSEIKTRYLKIRQLLDSASVYHYEVRRLASYGVAIMDDILNIYLVPPKTQALNRS